MLHLMLWLESHSDEYLARLDVKRSAKELGWSRSRVIRAVTDLEELGLISTEQVPFGQGTRTRFTLHLDEWSDPERVSKRDTPRVSKQDTPVYRNETPSKSMCNLEEQKESVAAFSVDSPAHQLCTQLADHIEQLGAKRPTITNTWLTDMDRAIRIDKRTPEQLAACIRWLSTPNRDAQFWSTNILSPKKLRANFDKMALQARAAKQPHRAPTPIEQAREMMAQRNAARQRSQGEGMVLGMTHGEQQ